MANKKKTRPKPQTKKKIPRSQPKGATASNDKPQAKSQTVQSKSKGPVLEIQGMAQFSSQVLESDKPVLVDFWAEWCGPCKAMSPLFEEYAELHKDDIVFASVDTERCRDVAEELNIRSLPTFLAFHEGKVIDMKVGVVMPVALEKWIDKLKKKTGITQEVQPPAPTPIVSTEEPKSQTLGQKIRSWFGGSKS